VNTPPLPYRCDSICCRLSNERFQEPNKIQSHSSVRKCCGCSLPIGHLNRHLILILSESCNIPLKIFENLARLMSVFDFPHISRESYLYSQDICTNRTAALHYSRASQPPFTLPFAETELAHHRMTSVFSSPSSPLNNLGVVETMLSAGYDVYHTPLVSVSVMKVMIPVLIFICY
jgi:hypothetical protein